MKNKITEIVFILDKSGSMAGFEDDTVGGFNATVERHREGEGEAFVTTFLFANRPELLHDRVNIRDLSAMRKEDFCVGGCTALLDTIGDAIVHIDGIHRYARAEDVPEHTVFIINTDGYENASFRYTGDKIKKLIKSKKEMGWEFIFLSADLDAVNLASSVGIDEDRIRVFPKSSKGITATHAAMADAICYARRGEDLSKADWGAGLDRVKKENDKNSKNKEKKGGQGK